MFNELFCGHLLFLSPVLSTDVLSDGLRRKHIWWQIRNSLQIILTTGMIMDIMAVFGIFHHFLWCILFYFNVTSPPRLIVPLSSGLITTMPQRDAKNHTVVFLFYASSFHLIPSIKSQRQEMLSGNELSYSIWVSFEEILSPSKQFGDDLSLQFLTVFP